jgi:hypothetical protein
MPKRATVKPLVRWESVLITIATPAAAAARA